MNLAEIGDTMNIETDRILALHLHITTAPHITFVVIDRDLCHSLPLVLIETGMLRIVLHHRLTTAHPHLPLEDPTTVIEVHPLALLPQQAVAGAHHVIVPLALLHPHYLLVVAGILLLDTVLHLLPGIVSVVEVIIAPFPGALTHMTPHFPPHIDEVEARPAAPKFVSPAEKTTIKNPVMFLAHRPPLAPPPPLMMKTKIPITAKNIFPLQYPHMFSVEIKSLKLLILLLLLPILQLPPPTITIQILTIIAMTLILLLLETVVEVPYPTLIMPHLTKITTTLLRLSSSLPPPLTSGSEKEMRSRCDDVTAGNR